jgi:hypothetical protein
VTMLEFPPVFAAADRVSLEAQRRFLRSTRAQLLLLVLAGAAGVFSITLGRLDTAALLGGVALLTAAGLRLRLLRTRPHSIWYEARAVAESVKTLAWRYAVCGNPFPLDGMDARSRFRNRPRVGRADRFDGGAASFGLSGAKEDLSRRPRA